MQRIHVCLFAVLLLLSSGFASTVSGTITDSNRVLLVGTIVEVMSGGAVIANATADKNGAYSVEVSDGIYFFRLIRGGYPLKVLLVDVKGSSTGTNFILSYHYPTATIYGVVSGESRSADFKVQLYKDGEFFKAAKVYNDGEFYLPDVYPGEYSVRTTSGNYDPFEERVSVSAEDVIWLNIGLKKSIQYDVNESTGTEETVRYSLEVPEKVLVGEDIVVKLISNTGSAPNKTITVVAPRAKPLNLTTDRAGEFRINAAEQGTYSFTFSGVTKTCEAVAVSGTVALGNQTPPPGAELNAPVGRTGFTLLEIGLFVGIAFAVALASLAALFIVTRERKPYERPEHRHAERPAEHEAKKPRAPRLHKPHAKK